MLKSMYKLLWYPNQISIPIIFDLNSNLSHHKTIQFKASLIPNSVGFNMFSFSKLFFFRSTTIAIIKKHENMLNGEAKYNVEILTTLNQNKIKMSYF